MLVDATESISKSFTHVLPKSRMMHPFDDAYLTYESWNIGYRLLMGYVLKLGRT